VIDHDEIELAVVEFRSGRDERAVSILTRVCNRNEQRPHEETVPIRRDRIFEWHEGRDLAGGKFQISYEATTSEPAFSESMRDHRVETKSRDVEEQATVELSDVDQP